MVQRDSLRVTETLCGYTSLYTFIKAHPTATPNGCILHSVNVINAAQLYPSKWLHRASFCFLPQFLNNEHTEYRMHFIMCKLKLNKVHLTSKAMYL